MKTKNLTKTGLIALLVGGLAAGGIMYNQTNKDQIIEKHTETVEDEDEWTVEQMEDYIRVSHHALETLQNEIDSPDTNAEERFAARTAYRYISEKLERVKKRLATVKKQQNLIINFNDTINSR